MRSEVELVWSMPFGALGWALGALAALGVLALALLSTAGRPPLLRAVLFGLRILAVAGLALLLLRPSWRRADVTRSQDHLVILVDGSASMGLPAEGGRTRAEEARAYLAAAARPLAALKRKHIVSVVGFDAGLAGDVTSPGAGGPQGAARPDAAAKGQARIGAPTGRATDLLSALGALRSRHPGRRLAGVVVLSDGRDTAALREGVDAQAAARLRGLDVPVNVVPLGGAKVRDAAVDEVFTDDLAFVRNVTRVRASLRVVGHQGPVKADLWIDGALKETVEARGGEEREAVFSFVPGQVGQLAGRVRVRPVEGEATVANNARRFVLRVVRDRVRILQIAGRPSWDVRFLRQHFKRDPNVDLVSFFILRTHMNITAAAPHELSLIQFPAEELFSSHLDGFDLVVMQDFERYPPYVGRYLDNIAAWVRRGGALALTGGEHTLSLGGFAGSRLATVLPVELLPDGPPSALLSDEAFVARPTPLAQHHPVTRAGGGDGLSPEVLGSLPPLEGVNRVARAHPEAAVLAEHPSLKGPDNRPSPVIAVRDVEAGRSLVLLTDTSWRWRFQPGGEGPGAYDAFWRRAVRYLIGDPEFQRLRLLGPAGPCVADGPSLQISALASDARREPERGVRVSWRLMELESDAPRVRAPSSAPAPGSAMAARSAPTAGSALAPGSARAPNAAPAPGSALMGAPAARTSPGAMASPTPGVAPATPGDAAGSTPQPTVSGPGELRAGSGETDPDGRLVLHLGTLSPGAYRVEAKAVLGGRQAQASAVMVAEGSAPELARVRPAPELLARVARVTGGRVLLRPEDLGRAAAHPPRVLTLNRLRTEPLVGSLWLLLALIVLALGAEWALRRRYALA